MGKITEISSQKNKTRVNLYIDGSFFCGLMTETLFANNLKVGDDVNEEKLKQVILESESRKAFNYILNLVSKKLYTKFEIITKLKKKGFEQEIIENVLNKLNEYKLIDDYEYAKQVCNAGSLKSVKQIEFKLMQKGIDKDIIRQITNGLDTKEEKQRILLISAKYFKNKPKTAENLQKFFRHLLQKGFTYDAVNDALCALKIEDID